jgi:TonB family protein
MSESYLISVAAKSTVLLAAAMLCGRLLRGRDAALRHLIYVAALASAAAVPLLALWSPQWSVLLSVPVGPDASGTAGTAAMGLSNWPAVLAALWALGALALLGRAAGGWLLLSHARRRSVHFQTGDGAEIRIADVSAPLTCGVLRPLILLPENVPRWNALRLRAVLLHESEHVRRRDCAAKYLAQIARALFWWNPLAWMVASRLDREQELACDQAVLAAGIPADTYANMLLDVARECSSPFALGCAMGANKSAAALSERFAYLFAWRPGAQGSTRRIAIAIPMLLLLLSAVSFAEKIYKVGPGIVAPMVLEKQNPVYPAREKAAKIQGTVALMVVVGVDRRAHDVKVTKSVTPALDASAMTAVRSWRFQPGTKNGKPVPVRAKIEIHFRLL